MAKIFKSDQYGDLTVPDNFADLSQDEQQKILKEAVRNKLSSEMSTGRVAQGIVDQGVQGLTLGTSDEIGAISAELSPANLVRTLFTDQEFGDAFSKRLREQRARNKEFELAYPKTAVASNIVGGAAPIAASFALSPFTGGSAPAVTTGITGARTAGILSNAKKILDSNRLLAGGITRPGATLGERTLEGIKMGGVQGLVGGIGYNESDADTVGGVLGDKLISGGFGGVTGGTLGTILPTGLKILSLPFKFASSTLKKFINSSDKNFSKNDIKAIEEIGNAFLRDEITADQVIQRIQANIRADKLEGISPVDILTDYGGDAVRRKLRGVNITEPGSRISTTLQERGSGTVESKGQDIIDDQISNIQSERVGRSLGQAAEETIDTQGINLSGGIDDIENAIQAKLNPLYQQAFSKNTKISNLNVYKFLEVPIIRDAYEIARRNYLASLQAKSSKPIQDSGIPSFQELFIRNAEGKITGVTKELPLEFFDQIKRAVDRKTFNLQTTTTVQKIGPGVVTSRKNVANQFREILKDSTKGGEYKTALAKSADKFALNDAFKLGQQLQKRSTKGSDFKKSFNNLSTDAEKDAFRVGVFQSISNQINSLGDNTNLAKKLLDSPDIRAKINVLFSGNDEAKKLFIQRLMREDRIAKTNQLVLGGSNTAEKTADAGLLQPLIDLLIATEGPGSSAGVRAAGATTERLKGSLFDPLGSRANSLQNILLESSPERQKDIINLMRQLQDTEAQRSAVENIFRRSGLRVIAPPSGEMITDVLR